MSPSAHSMKLVSDTAATGSASCGTCSPNLPSSRDWSVLEELEPRAGLFGAGQVGVIDQAIRKQLQSPDLRLGRLSGIGIETVTTKQDWFPGACGSISELGKSARKLTSEIPATCSPL